MGKIIGYGKLGRSMPLTLERCGNLGGDVEMVAVVKEMALRHPDNAYILIGRNSGENPQDVGLPENVHNPWNVHYPYGGGPWKPQLDAAIAADGDIKGETLTPARQLRLAKIFDDITFKTFESLDAMVMWVGQHGTSNTPIPKVEDPTQLTKPQDWCAWYSGFMLRGINRWRDVDPWNREEICLNADARNRHKMRDMKWPLRHPILAQFNSEKPLKHHRYGDFREPVTPGWPGQEWTHYATQIGDYPSETWLSTVRDTYARLEINGLRPGTPFGDLISFNDDWQRSGDFGLFINEARAIGIRPELQRKNILRDWVMPLKPHFVHGTWSKESGYHEMIKPAPWDQYYPKLHSVRCTFTTPSSGSGWATAKPWEAFAAGTVCFFHPEYDTQNNILGDASAELQWWLRVKTPKELRDRIDSLAVNPLKWRELVALQREHFDRALKDLTYMKMIEKRIYGDA
jgi:hypothetical protein